MIVIRRNFRWFHESAFLVSVPFLLAMFYGIVTRSRETALFAAVFVVALNLGRAAAGISGLVTLVLLDGIRLAKMKKPLQRVLDPLLTIEAIILLFTFIPWLSSVRPADRTITERLQSSARGLGDEMTGVLHEAIGKASKLETQQIGEQAREFLGTPAPKALDNNQEPATP